MRRWVAVAVVVFAAALGSPVRGEVLVGMAGPLTGKDAPVWYVWRGDNYMPAE